MIGWADGSVHRIDIFATTLAKQAAATIESTAIKDLGESSFNYRGSSDSFFASEDSVVSRFRRGRGEKKVLRGKDGMGKKGNDFGLLLLRGRIYGS